MLIDFYKSNFVLWYPTVPNYRNRLKKLDASYHVAMVMGSGSNKCGQPHNHTLVFRMFINLSETLPETLS